MTAGDLIPLMPLVVLTAATVALLVLIAVRRHHGAAATLCALGLALAFVAVPLAAARRSPVDVTPLITVDGYTLFFQGVILLAALGVALLSCGYFARRTAVPREEYYVLLLTATLGATTIVASRHFAAFFLGLETLSLSLVALVAYPAALERPVEAGLKYLILSGVSSAFLLFGIALIYYASGALSLGSIALAGARGLTQLYGISGLALVLVGMGFKLSIVPFHLWAPDVYEGAPAPVTAYVAVVSKTAVLALLLRYYLSASAFGTVPALVALSAAAILSMIAGNLLALLQRNVKRLLAYSSIAHLGYALVAFLAGGTLAIEAVSVYLVAYAISTLGAFGVVAMLSSGEHTRARDQAPATEHPSAAEHAFATEGASAAEQPSAAEADDIDDYRGLFQRHPALAATFTVMLLSLAGIPITVGFIAKFYAVTSGVGASLTAPLGALVAGSIIGLYYYLRIIVAMIQPAPEAVVQRVAGSEDESAPHFGTRALSSGVMAILVVLLIGLGVYPAPLVTLIRATATTIGRVPTPLAVSRIDLPARARETGRLPLHHGNTPWPSSRTPSSRSTTP